MFPKNQFRVLSPFSIHNFHFSAMPNITIGNSPIYFSVVRNQTHVFILSKSEGRSTGSCFLLDPSRMGFCILLIFTTLCIRRIFVILNFTELFPFTPHCEEEKELTLCHFEYFDTWAWIAVAGCLFVGYDTSISHMALSTLLIHVPKYITVQLSPNCTPIGSTTVMQPFRNRKKEFGLYFSNEDFFSRFFIKLPVQYLGADVDWIILGQYATFPAVPRFSDILSYLVCSLSHPLLSQN